MQTIVNGRILSRSCSGTLIAPRVVLTAAHCLDDVWSNQVFAYFGDSFNGDFGKLQMTGQTIVVPAPGQPSKFAQADSYEVHAGWLGAQPRTDPDIGVVYLDRKVPYTPLPVMRRSVDNSWIGKDAKLVGWGASRALSADITQTAGKHVQRSGKAKILGTPTIADYHADDPNPAMLVPQFRAHYVKTDGRAPNSNICAGDSGSPMLLTDGGQDAVAGVAAWTGLWCEEYSLFTRVDPFLPFIDTSIQRGGTLPVTPKLECVAHNADGSLSAYFGYENQNRVTVTVPKGPQNALALDTTNRRITQFRPGSHSFVFGVDFKKDQKLVYTLAPESGPSTTLTVTKQSKQCGPGVAAEVSCGNFCRGVLNSGCAAPPSAAQCMADCIDTFDFFPGCRAALIADNNCYGTTQTGSSHWACGGPGVLPMSLDCAAQDDALFSCFDG